MLCPLHGPAAGLAWGLPNPTLPTCTGIMKMTRTEMPIVAGVALALLAGCSAPQEAEPVNATRQELPAAPDEAATTAQPSAVPAPTAIRRERSDKARPAPPPPTPPVVQRPVTPPREVRPPEVHPPHREPGDEVPR